MVQQVFEPDVGNFTNIAFEGSSLGTHNQLRYWQTLDDNFYNWHGIFIEFQIDGLAQVSTTRDPIVALAPPRQFFLIRRLIAFTYQNDHFF